MNDAAPLRRIWLCADDYGLAEGVNRIAVRGVASADIAATRRTLVTVLVNLARDELRSLQNTGGAGAKSRRGR